MSDRKNTDNNNEADIVIGADGVLDPSDNSAALTPLNPMQLAASGNGAVSLLDDAPVAFTRASVEIVYGVGESSQQGFRSASLAMRVGNQAMRRWIELVPVKTPLVVVVVGVKECWREYCKYTPGVFPREFDTLREALDAGLTDKWTGTYPNGVGPTVAPCMYLDMFVQRPEGIDDDLFCLKMDGKWYAPALLRADKQLYNPIATAVKLRLKKDAGERGVALSEAKMDKTFSTLTSFSSMKGEKVNYQVVLGVLVKDGQPVPVSDKFREDFVNLLQSNPVVADTELDD